MSYTNQIEKKVTTLEEDKKERSKRQSRRWRTYENKHTIDKLD